MRVPVVEIGVMRVLVPHRFMTVQMGMRLRDGAVMTMIVMFVVRVGVLMFKRLVTMFVLVPFSQV